MSKRETVLELDREDAMYLPGEMLTVRCWVPDRRDVEAVHVLVLWYTEGKGDEDRDIVFQERLTPGRGSRDCLQCKVRLPNSPLSYDGVILKIHWLVRLRVIVQDRPAWEDEVPFRLGNVPAARKVSP
jgi:hypothetical protein